MFTNNTVKVITFDYKITQQYIDFNFNYPLNYEKILTLDPTLSVSKLETIVKNYIINNNLSYIIFRNYPKEKRHLIYKITGRKHVLKFTKVINNNNNYIFEGDILVRLYTTENISDNDNLNSDASTVVETETETTETENASENASENATETETESETSTVIEYDIIYDELQDIKKELRELKHMNYTIQLMVVVWWVYLVYMDPVRLVVFN